MSSFCFPFHRCFNISLVFERRWYPEEEAFKKKLKHRALDDIRESLAEMKFYQNVYFRSQEEVAENQKSSAGEKDEGNVPT